MTVVMMTFSGVSSAVVLCLLCLSALRAVNAAEQPTNQPTREQLRQQLRQLSPEERQEKIREIRGKLGTGSTWRAEAERRRDEWKDLSPERRRAKMLEWRALRGGEPAADITPENRNMHRQQIRERLLRQLQDLNVKKSQGGLTPEEQKRLENLEQVSKYFNASPAPSAKP
jgi:hypothetical protein